MIALMNRLTLTFFRFLGATDADEKFTVQDALFRSDISFNVYGRGVRFASNIQCLG